MNKKFIAILLLQAMTFAIISIESESKQEEYALASLGGLPPEVKVVILSTVKSASSVGEIFKKLAEFAKINTEFKTLAKDDRVIKSIIQAFKDTHPGYNLTEEFITAVILGRIQLAENLIDFAGVDVNSEDLRRKAALMYASRSQHPEIVKMLLSKGASPMSIGPGISSALHWAAAGGNKEIMDLLIKAVGPDNVNAYVNAIGNHGRTPLMYASKYGKLDAVKMLIAHGANVSVADDIGESARDIALWNKKWDIVDFFDKIEAEKAAAQQ